MLACHSDCAWHEHEGEEYIERSESRAQLCPSNGLQYGEEVGAGLFWLYCVKFYGRRTYIYCFDPKCSWKSGKPFTVSK